MTLDQTQGIGHQKYLIHAHCSTPSPKFSSVSLHDQPFLRYSTFYDFPIDCHVKISKCHKIFKFWQIAKTFIILHPLMTALFIIKFGSGRIKSVGGVAF